MYISPQSIVNHEAGGSAITRRMQEDFLNMLNVLEQHGIGYDDATALRRIGKAPRVGSWRR